MSSDSRTAAEDRSGWSCKGREYIATNAAAVAQLLEDTPAPDADDPVWVATDVSLDRGKKHGAIASLRRLGAIDKVDREYYSAPSSANRGGSVRNRYRWRPAAYDEIQSYLDDMTTFPDCKHRAHVYNPRDTPDDVLACRECGTEYRKSVVRRLL